VNGATAQRRPRILFATGAVTLAHVARPLALMAALEAERYETAIACPEHARRFLGSADASRLPLSDIAPSVFAARLARGAPVFDAAELQAAVDEDLDLLRSWRPDLVVGDFRLSLSVSARLAGVRYATLANAYWSPYAPRRTLPVPVLGWTRYAPLALVQPAFDRLQPRLLAPHCRPLNTVRVARGLPSLGDDLRRVYTDADDVLYADSVRLFPLAGAPASHRHLGPIVWSPPIAPPPWWDDPPPPGALVYVTMGSSGDAALLDTVLDALEALDVPAIVATAGAPAPRARRQVRFADYLPGEAAAARSRLVICNGGSPTSQQALAAGVPVLGICSNLDQMLNMRGLEAAAAGIALRADRATTARVRDAALALLGCDDDARRALRVVGASDAPRRFAGFVATTTGPAAGTRR
jgi:UDP:flavonoid glycosyltransferase YjiC (YdhE family)